MLSAFFSRFCEIENHILPFICSPSALHFIFLFLYRSRRPLKRRSYPNTWKSPTFKLATLCVLFVRICRQECALLSRRWLCWMCMVSRWCDALYTLYILNLSESILAARDVVKYLADMRVSSIQDFDYVSQLRYYWRVDESEFFGGSLLKIILLILHILHLQIMPIGFVLLWWLLRSNTAWNTWAIYHAWLWPHWQIAATGGYNSPTHKNIPTRMTYTCSINWHTLAKQLSHQPAGASLKVTKANVYWKNIYFILNFWWTLTQNTQKELKTFLMFKLPTRQTKTTTKITNNHNSNDNKMAQQ